MEDVHQLVLHQLAFLSLTLVTQVYHLCLDKIWVFLPFESSCHLGLFLFGCSFQLDLLVILVFLLLGSFCHLSLLAIWVLLHGSPCPLGFLLLSFSVSYTFVALLYKFLGNRTWKQCYPSLFILLTKIQQNKWKKKLVVSEYRPWICYWTN